MSLAYPAYGLALLLLVATTVAGHVGLGAQRWIALGPLQLQPSELMKISLVLALSRYLHGLSVEDVSKAAQACHSAGDDRGAHRARADGAQSRHGNHPDGGWLLASVSRRPFLVVDRAGGDGRGSRSARSPGSSCCTTIRSAA